MTGVPWRRAIVTLVALVLGLGGVFVALRSDGFSAIDATVPRATRWFVDRDRGILLLADGFAGVPLARIEAGEPGQDLEVVQSASGVALLDRSAALARVVDAATLRLGQPEPLGILAEPETVVGIGQTGIVAIDPAGPSGVLLPLEGTAVPIEVAAAGRADATRIAPDGAVWTLAGGSLSRITTTGAEVLATGLSTAEFSLVGNTVLLLDRDRARVRFGDGAWQPLPAGVDASEFVLQQPGPIAECGWIGANDGLWCIDGAGARQQVAIDGLDVDGGDLLAIAGDAGALVRRATSTIVRIDWRAGAIVDTLADSNLDGASDSLKMASSVDLVWIDDTDGNYVWAVHPWGVNEIPKNDASAPLIGDSGEAIDAGTGEQPLAGEGTDAAETIDEREPDDNGIDDPPVAIDDPVTARFGLGVSIVVTANDYDPDGEAVAVVAAGNGLHGQVSISSATTVQYSPSAGYVGLDEFEYTIADGSGDQAIATVTIQLLAADAANRAPVGSPDQATTGNDVPVVIDVLVNDIDPERDGLRIGSFTAADTEGTLLEVEGPSGLPALAYTPTSRLSGTVAFKYRPVDSFGAVGDAVDVTVEIARPGADNRPPVTHPDAVRGRRDLPLRVPVVENDRDPDGDRLAVSVVRPVPPGLEVRVDGQTLVVVARAGSDDLVAFQYSVSDGVADPVVGQVLVSVIADAEPNRPPVANADTDTAVAGVPTRIDVLANDTDPDRDRLTLVSVSPWPDGSTIGAIAVVGGEVEYVARPLATDDAVFDRFLYTIIDGRGNPATGEVSVRVLPERVDAPPFARDDAATTEVDVAVTIDVLGNDGDLSGEEPTLLDPIGCAGGGTATVTESQSVRFAPPPGATGLFTCTYEVVNSQGLTAHAAILVNVVAPPDTNQAPVVGDLDKVVEINGRITIQLLEQASDPDGPVEELEILSWTPPTIGRADQVGTTLVFDAPPSVDVATISFQVGDAAGGIASGSVRISIVEPEPIAPVATSDMRTIIGPAVPVMVAALENDSDQDGPATDLRITNAARVSGEAVVTFTTTIVTITPPAEYVGDIVVTYDIVDLDGKTDSADIVVTVLERPNRAPIARDDEASVVSGGAVSIPIASNDQDPDGDPLTYTITAGPAGSLGTAALVAGNVLEFVAQPGAAGVATVQYMVSDGELSAVATVRITVLACAEAMPDAPDLFLMTGYQQPILIDLTTVARNGDVVEVGQPLGAPSGVYTPPAGENGNVSFTYVVRNACRLQDVGRVTIDVNQDPVSGSYAARIGRHETISITIAALASDAEPLVISALEGAPDWITTSDENRALSVAPAGRAGSVNFIAIVSDPGGLTARVPIAIELINLAPIANNDEFRADDGSAVIEPLANDNDPDGDAIALQSVPATITFSNDVTVALEQLNATQIRVDPGDGVGIAAFTYSIVDAHGLVSASATVTIRVNTPPTAPPVDVQMDPETSVTVVIPATDPDGGVLIAELIDDPAPFEITIDGLTLTIVAPPGLENITKAFTYRVTDSLGGRDLNVITISVGPLPTTTTIPPTTTTLAPTTTTLPPTTTTLSPMPPTSPPQG